MSDMFDEALCALKKLVAIDSVQAAPCDASPFGEGVAKCLQFVADDAKSRGFKVGLGDGYYVWAETGEGDLFGVLGHLDTVPLGGGWHADPLGEIKDGVFYGRGVLDDKGPMTLAFYAALSLLKEGKKPKRRIRFIWGGNEESGWKCIERYLQREEVPKEGISPDADFPVINCEKGVAHVRLTFAKPKEVVSMKGGERVNVVMPECRAKVRGEIECDLAESVSDGATELVAHGAAAHGSTPFEGVNAGWKMLKTLADFSPECGRLAELLCDHDGSGLGIACRDEKSGALTCNMGIIDTDTKNIIVELDIRHPVDVPRDDILKRLKEVEGVKSVELTAFHDPLYVAPDDELVTALSDAYNACTGESAKPIAIGGATYARALPKAVAFGPVFPGEKSTIHMPDERQSLEKLRKIYDIYRASFERLLFE